MFRFLGTPPQWMSTAFPIIQTILLVLVALSSFLILIAILAQPSNPDGGDNAITGISGSYYSQNKGTTWEGRLQKLIIICAIVIFASTIIYFVLDKLLTVL